MTLNCLQNKTAALNLELDKKAGKTGIELERWKIRGRKGGGTNELMIKSLQAMNTRIKMPLQVVLGTYQKATKEGNLGKADHGFLSWGLHLKT